MLTIEIWFDLACPYCYIGKHVITQAIKQLDFLSIKLIPRSFELAPHMPITHKQGIYENLQNKYGVTLQQAHAMTRKATEVAHSVGLSLHFDTLIATNTLQAHQLIHFAAQNGLGINMLDRLFQAHFVEGADIGDFAILATLAQEIGLEHTQTLAILNSDAYIHAVHQDETQARTLGVQSVPFFWINQQQAISGGQSVETWIHLLQETAKNTLASDQHGSTKSCTLE